MIVIASLFALACAGMGFVGGLTSLFVALLSLRALGQGSLSLVSIQAVNLWFVRRRGIAVGCMGLGLAGATVLFPFFVEPVLPDLGWRQVYLLLGAGVAGLMLPAGALFFRDRPEAFGLVPDGKAIQPDDRASKEANVPLHVARRKVIFWLVTAGGVCVSALGTGLMFHHFSIMAQYGLDRSAAALLFLPLGVATAAANLGAGYVVDRFRPDYVLVTMTTLLAGVLLCLPLISGTRGVWLYGAAFGLERSRCGILAEHGSGRDVDVLLVFNNDFETLVLEHRRRVLLGHSDEGSRPRDTGRPGDILDADELHGRGTHGAATEPVPEFSVAGHSETRCAAADLCERRERHAAALAFPRTGLRPVRSLEAP